MSKGRTRGPGERSWITETGAATDSILCIIVYCLPRGVPSRVRGHCQQAAWLAVPLAAFGALGEDQEPGSSDSHARGGGGLEPLISVGTPLYATVVAANCSSRSMAARR
jgi:hypothetical protein